MSQLRLETLSEQLIEAIPELQCIYNIEHKDGDEVLSVIFLAQHWKV